MGKWMNKILTSESPHSQGDHIPLENLAQLIDGEVDQKERDGYINHLNTCEECYELLTETLKGMPEKDLKKKKDSIWSGRTIYAIAASIILVCIIGGNFFLNLNRPPQLLVASITLDQDLKDILLENESIVWEKEERIDRLTAMLRSKGVKIEELNRVELDSPYFQGKDPFGKNEILKNRVEKGVAYLVVIQKE